MDYPIKCFNCNKTLADDKNDKSFIIASTDFQEGSVVHFVYKDQTQIEIKCSRCKKLNLILDRAEV